MLEPLTKSNESLTVSRTAFKSGALQRNANPLDAPAGIEVGSRISRLTVSGSASACGGM
jgi:hypothetical protein